MLAPPTTPPALTLGKPQGLHLAGRAPSAPVSWNSSPRSLPAVAGQAYSPGPGQAPLFPTATRASRPHSVLSSAGLEGGHCRLSQTEGLRLRKSRPGTSAPARGRGPTFPRGPPACKRGTAGYREFPGKKGVEMIPVPLCPACSASELPSPPP